MRSTAASPSPMAARKASTHGTRHAPARAAHDLRRHRAHLRHGDRRGPLHGAIAAVAFVLGDYASEIFRLGSRSSAIYAALGVAGLTALNVAGTLESKLLQRLMQVALFAGLLFIALAGLLAGSPPPASETASG